MGLDEGDAQLGLHSTGCLSQEAPRTPRACFTVGFTTRGTLSLTLTHVNSGSWRWHPNFSCGCKPGQITVQDFLSPETQMGPTCTFIPVYKVIKLKQFLLLSSCIK